MIKLPSLKDISPSNCLQLDEKVAVENFHGKSLEEAKKMFHENALYYECDLMWMGQKAFAFYYPALVSYLYSDESAMDADIINSFIGTLNFRIKYDIQSIRLAHESVTDALIYSVTNYSKFGISKEIYGDLNDKLEKLIKGVIGVRPESH